MLGFAKACMSTRFSSEAGNHPLSFTFRSQVYILNSVTGLKPLGGMAGGLGRGATDIADR